MEVNMPGRHSKRLWLWLAGFTLAGGLLGILAAHEFSGRLKNWVRDQAIETLNARFASQASFAEFNVAVYPRIRISGRGLALRLAGHPDSPPLIAATRFSAEASLLQLIRRPIHVHNIRLQGLEIQVPPRQVRPTGEPAPGRPKHRRPLPIVVDQMLIEKARLALLSSGSAKPPRLFVIKRLVMRQKGLGQPTLYHAWLLNPKPPGDIDCSGTFGPWDRMEPRSTPLTGQYTFTHADLSVFRGIAGVLSSKGDFHGVLDDIEVQGTTDTPDFSVRLTGNFVHLTTGFHSIVDGTTGNTMLEPVDAQFLNTSLTARGGVLKVAGEKGRVLDLLVTSAYAHMSDLLRLTMRGGNPPLRGIARLKTTLEIPPGPGDIADRVRLHGQLRIHSVRFMAPLVNQKIQALSQKGLGKHHEAGSDQLSNLQAQFDLRNALFTFQTVTFAVPGAAIKLSGTFALHTQTVNFEGTLRLQAPISQIVTGKKSFLLIPFDPFLRRGKAGTVLPIKVTGTADHPTFQLEVGRLLRHAYD
jgi:hypothetical protein